MNCYILSYNPFETKLSPNQLLGWIKESHKVYQWYSPFIGTYVLKSGENIAVLSEFFRTAFDGAPFLLTHANPAFVSGAQTPEVWTWINANGLMEYAIPAPKKG